MKTNRRDLLKILATVPAVAAPAAAAAQAHDHPTPPPPEPRPSGPYKPQALNAHEFRTARVLADLIIPADGVSGSASQAGVARYIDEMIVEWRGRMESTIHGGLAWLDHECNKRFGKPFADCKVAQQTEILDLIAWPEKATPETTHAITFFNLFRDLTAGGFYTSKVGIDDLGFKGNTVVAEWKGCPAEVLKKLGVDG